MAPRGRGTDRFADAASLGDVCYVANTSPVWIFAEEQEALDFAGPAKGILPPGSKVRLLDVDAGGRWLVEVISTPKLWVGTSGEDVAGTDEEGQGGGGPIQMSRLNAAPAGGLRAVMAGAWRNTSCTALARNPLEQRSLRIYVPPPRIAEAAVPPENQCYGHGGRLPRGWVMPETAPRGEGCILRPIREQTRDYLRPWQDPPPRPSSAPKPPRPSTALADVYPDRAKRLRALSREARSRSEKKEVIEAVLPAFASVYRDSPYVGRPTEVHVRHLRHHDGSEDDAKREDAPPFCGVVGRNKTEQATQLRAAAASQAVSIRPPDDVKGGDNFHARPHSAPKAWGGCGPPCVKAQEVKLDACAARIGVMYEKVPRLKEPPPAAIRGLSRSQLEQMVLELEEANAAARARLGQNGNAL